MKQDEEQKMRIIYQIFLPLNLNKNLFEEKS